MTTSVILLAGGTGTRMKSQVPKQFMPLKNKPIIQYSFDTFMECPLIAEVVVVVAKEYQHLFKRKKTGPLLTFAEPGIRRQDSVENGFMKLSSNSSIVCIHDGARPFVTQPMIQRSIEAAQEYGAATVGMPVKYTVKETNSQQLVTNTPDRSYVWEIQTPQAIRHELLKKGLDHAKKHQITVTDDVSFVELINHPVKIVEGCYSNIKITTPEDFILSEIFVNAKKL